MLGRARRGARTPRLPRWAAPRARHIIRAVGLTCNVIASCEALTPARTSAARVAAVREVVLQMDCPVSFFHLLPIRCDDLDDGH